MRKKNLIIAGFTLAIVIVGYKLAMPAQAKDPKVELPTAAQNGINLPPHPGSLADSTRIGVDANNNGVRDEVEIYLATKYGSNKEQYQKILEFVKKKQSILNIPLEDDEAAKKYNIWADSSSCLSKKLGINDSEAASMYNDLTAQVFNNLERQTHFQDIMLKSDQLEDNPENTVCE
jgi:hypothetical protein